MAIVVAIAVVVFVRMMSLQCPMLLSTGTEIPAGSVDGTKHVMFHLLEDSLKYSSCRGSCEPKDRMVFDQLKCSDIRYPLTMVQQQLRGEVWKICMHTNPKHPVVL